MIMHQALVQILTQFCSPRPDKHPIVVFFLKFERKLVSIGTEAEHSGIGTSHCNRQVQFRRFAIAETGAKAMPRLSIVAAHLATRSRVTG